MSTKSKPTTRRPKVRTKPMSPKSGIGNGTKYACGGKIKRK